MASSTREKILAVSLRLFNEQGYRSVTMRAFHQRGQPHLSFLQKAGYRRRADGRHFCADDRDGGYARSVAGAD